LREIRFALQECGRKLAAKLRARDRAESEARRRDLFQRYIPELGDSIGKITGKAPKSIEKLFYDTLPNFVKNLELGNGAASEPPAASEGSESAEGAEATENVEQAAEKAPAKKGRARKPAAETAPAKAEKAARKRSKTKDKSAPEKPAKTKSKRRS